MSIGNKHVVVVDWGTTNFRAFLLDDNQQLLDSVKLNQGLLQIRDRQFGNVLETTLSNWLSDYRHLPVMMAGMVGSAKGWVKVDYVSTAAALGDLAGHAYRFMLPWGASGTIIPGVSHHIENHKYDVMRGEEVQVFGLAKQIKQENFVAILPGTHSKHVVFEDNRISAFKSFLTGECYSLLGKHSLLATGAPGLDTFDADVFSQGVLEAQDGELTNKLFLGWTKQLFNSLSEQKVNDYLSGMMIGYELKNLHTKQVYLVGSPALCQRYAVACNLLSIESVIANGDHCFLDGMIEIGKRGPR